jgi:hypothetical protein
MEEATMTFLAQLAVAAVLAVGMPASLASAQSNQAPPSKSADAGDQFKAGADQLGRGFERIGDGFKQGAIQVWEAMKAGGQAVGDKFNGQSSGQGRSSQPKAAPAAPQPRSDEPAPYAQEPANH